MATSSHLTILTGASRGLGLAMAEQLIDAGHKLLCIARKTSDVLAARAASKGATLEQWPQDLDEADPVAARLETWIKARGESGLASITLINNAGMVPRVAPLGEVPASEVSQALRVGLEAPRCC